MTVDRRLIDLYNEYVHTAMPRRDFIARLTQVAGGAAAATMALGLLEPNYARAQQVPPDDRRVKAERLEFNGPNGPIKAYTARPRRIRTGEKIGGVLVVHENRGLNGYIEDVVRRVAIAGYVAIAPDGLSVAGGAPADQEAARDLFAKTDGVRIASDVLEGIPWLAADPTNNGKVGVVGFCYGGGVALRAAVESSRNGVDCAVAFYGKQPPAAEAKQIRVPLLLHYAENDERIDAGIKDFRAVLDEQHVTYDVFMYPGTDHGFHNDSSAARYNEAAAKLAWERTLVFFAQYLKADVTNQ
jgi:carboxymethylenebutenolidase